MTLPKIWRLQNLNHLEARGDLSELHRGVGAVPRARPARRSLQDRMAGIVGEGDRPFPNRGWCILR